MKKLFVLYDPKCAFCRNCRRWLEAQPAYVTLHFVPSDSPEAEQTIPGIGQFVASNELTAVADDGAIYQGPNAFIICLYALVEYRDWSIRLSRPALLPFARQFFSFISDHRATFSKWMKNRSDEELASSLQNSPPPYCDSETRKCITAVSSGRSN